MQALLNESVTTIFVDGRPSCFMCSRKYLHHPLHLVEDSTKRHCSVAVLQATLIDLPLFSCFLPFVDEEQVATEEGTQEANQDVNLHGRLDARLSGRYTTVPG